MQVRAKDRIRLPDGRVGTVQEFFASGDLVPVRRDRFSTSGRSKARVAYFADLADGQGCYEIGKRVYDAQMQITEGS